MTTAADIARAYPGAASVASDVVALGAEIGADPAWIANVIQFESSWNPRAVNPRSGASGLIQFMPATATALGTTVQAIRQMTAAQQWPFVRAYFARFRGRLNSQADVFMAVFYPAAIGKGPGYTFSQRVQKANPGIRTAGDYTAKALRRARLSASVLPPPPSSALPPLRPTRTGRGGGGSRRRRGLTPYRAKVVLGSAAAVFVVIALVATVARVRMR